MTVSTSYQPLIYKPGAGSLAQSIEFQFLDAAHLRVTHVEAATGNRAELTRDVEFSVAGDGMAAAGQITALDDYAADDEFVVERVTPAQQQADLEDDVKLPVADIERSLDTRVLVQQELLYSLTRTLQVPLGQQGPALLLDDLVNGDILEYHDGAFRRADFTEFAGRATAFDNKGQLQPFDGVLPDVPATATNIATSSGKSVQDIVDGRSIVNAAEFDMPNGGATDARAVLAALEADASIDTIVFKGGTYRVASTLVMSKNFVLLDGAKFVPDSGVTFHTTGAVNGKRGVDLIIIAGQSNAAGSAPNSGLEAALNRNWTNCKIWNGTTYTTMGLANNRGTSTSEHGCEFEIARQYQQQGRQVYLIKYGVGGSSLDYRASLNSWYPHRGDVNRAFFAYVEKALGALDREDVAIRVAWIQGAADANGGSTGMAKRYEQNFVALFKQMTEAFDPVQITVARTNANIAPATYTALADVRAGQVNAVAQIPHAGWVDTDSLTIDPLDGLDVHFDSAGQSGLGIKLFNVFNQKKLNFSRARAFPRWQRSLLINPREEGVGATALATSITAGTTVDNAASNGLGIGLHLTNTASYGSGAGAATIALASLDTFPASKGFEANIDLISGGGGNGGFIFCADDSGTYVAGYFVRVTGGDIKLFRVDFTGAVVQLGGTYTGVLSVDRPIGIRAIADGGSITVSLKVQGQPWVAIIDADDSTYRAGGCYITSGWGASDEEAVRFGNITPIGSV